MSFERHSDFSPPTMTLNNLSWSDGLIAVVSEDTYKSLEAPGNRSQGKLLTNKLVVSRCRTFFSGTLVA